MMYDRASFAVSKDLTTQIDLSEAPGLLEQLIDAAIAGEDVVIAEHGTPLVRLIPYEPDSGESFR